MEQENLHLNIPAEWFYETFIFPFLGHSITYEAMALFGGYNMTIAMTYATIGAMIGSLANWMIGHLALSFNLKIRKFITEDNYDHLSGLMRRYGIILLPFFWIPMGGAFLILAGFFQVRWWIALPLVAIGQIIYLTYLK